MTLKSLAETPKYEIKFGTFVRSAQYDDYGTRGVVTNIWHNYFCSGRTMIQIHWSNGTNSFFSHVQYSKVFIDDSQTP